MSKSEKSCIIGWNNICYVVEWISYECVWFIVIVNWIISGRWEKSSGSGCCCLC